MGTELIVIIVMISLVILLAIEIPVAFCLAGSGALGLVLLRGTGVASATLANLPFHATSSFTLTVIPMFILMGMFAMQANIAEDLFRVTNRALYFVRGGIAVATIITCAGFAAVCGSSVATAATVGKLTIKEMQRYGFSGGFAGALVASAGTLGVLIPPSIVLVIFGIITDESIGALLLAGVIPGIVSALIMMIGVLILAYFGYGYDVNIARNASITDSNLRSGNYGGILKLVILFVIVIGGIYTGLITATEAAAMGALASLVMLLLSVFKGQLGFFSALKEALSNTASLTSMVFAILVGASIFSFFLVSAGVPNDFADWVLSFNLSPSLLVLLLLLSLVPLGMILDGVSIQLITVPLFYPVVVTELGFDGLWYAILTVKMIELGLITPPVGVNAFIVANLVGKGGLEKIFRSLSIFVLLDLIIFSVLFIFPAISTWLPSQMN
jgi:C4-dicarboxylate transporter DctM subunit